MGGAIRAAVLFAILLGLTVAAPAQASLGASVQGTTLTVTSDGAPDKLTVAGNGTNLDLDFGSDGTVDQSVPRASFTSTLIDMGGGDDSVTLTGTLASDGITVNGGDGADTIAGGPAPETLNGGDGADVIDGNAGNDTENGGAGNDRFQWDPGDGSDVLDGGEGEDSLQFNGSNANEQVSVTGSGSRALLTRDVGAISQDMGSIEDLTILLIGGMDTYTGGTGASSAAGLFHSLVVNGGTGGDTLNGGDADETLIGGGADADTVNGGAGNDTFPRSITEVTADTVDGGPGVDTLSLTGFDWPESYTVDSPGAGMASVSQSPDFGTQSAAGVERVALQTLGGDDTVSMTPEGSANLALDASGGAGQDTLTGGQNADVLRGGDGEDRIDGQDGNDQLFGDAGIDELTGGPGSDTFNCGGFGDVLDDATSDDTVASDCLAPTPPTSTVTPPAQPSAQTVTVVVPAFLGVSVSGNLRTLKLIAVNRHTAAVRLSLSGTEVARGAKKVRYKSVTKSVGAKRSATFILKTPAKLRRALAATLKRRGKVVRTPKLILTNVDTHATLPSSPRIVITR